MSKPLALGYIKLLKDKVVVLTGQQFEFWGLGFLKIVFGCNFSWGCGCYFSSNTQSPTSAWSILIVGDFCEKYIYKRYSLLNIDKGCSWQKANMPFKDY